MPVLPPSRASRSPLPRRILQLASLGLAGLLAGLLTGCNGNSASLLQAHNDTDWQTTSTYASATASTPASTADRSSRIPHTHEFHVNSYRTHALHTRLK